MTKGNQGSVLSYDGKGEMNAYCLVGLFYWGYGTRHPGFSIAIGGTKIVIFLVSVCSPDQLVFISCNIEVNPRNKRQIYDQLMQSMADR